MTDAVDLNNLDQMELRRFRAFGERLFARVRPAPETLWHYTTGTGLVGIICSGTLFATQVRCLNDTSEYQYLANLIREESAERANLQVDPERRELFTRIVQLMGDRKVSAANAFVTCLSAAADDLGQWRGYGGDACAFAIEFETARLQKDLTARGGNTVLMRVQYDQTEHQEAVQMLLDNFVESTRRLWSKDAEGIDGWLNTFGRGYTELASMMHARVKHPSFACEKEYRIYTELLHGEHETLKFTAKRTLLARHIAVALGEGGHLPIRSIMVGPGAAQEASVVSVGDLLKSKGYGTLPVSRSSVPYRVV